MKKQNVIVIGFSLPETERLTEALRKDGHLVLGALGKEVAVTFLRSNAWDWVLLPEGPEGLRAELWMRELGLNYPLIWLQEGLSPDAVLSKLLPRDQEALRPDDEGVQALRLEGSREILGALEETEERAHLLEGTEGPRERAAFILREERETLALEVPELEGASLKKAKVEVLVEPVFQEGKQRREAFSHGADGAEGRMGSEGADLHDEALERTLQRPAFLPDGEEIPSFSELNTGLKSAHPLEDPAPDVAIMEKWKDVAFGDYFQILELEREASPYRVKEQAERLKEAFSPEHWPHELHPKELGLLNEILAGLADAEAVLSNRELRKAYERGLSLRRFSSQP